jgi:DNA-directed RNA polymerase specialized sigma24 family protein
MSAALQLPVVWGAAAAETAWNQIKRNRRQDTPVAKPAEPVGMWKVDPSLAFYRRHTQSTLRRYLYASMLVGRTPHLLGDSVRRGWVSSRPIRTFEDAVIFALDVESCLKKLNLFERELLSRIVLQEYTFSETAELLGVSNRTVNCKFPQALDKLTQLLLDAKLLVLPH